MAERIPPPPAPEDVDAAVHVLRQRAEQPPPTNGSGRIESTSERRLLYVTLVCLALAAISGIGEAVFVGWQAAADREEARAVDARALDEQRCRAEFSEAQRTAAARLDLAERPVDAARTNIELALIGQITGGELTPATAAALQAAYVDAIAATADEL